MHSKNLLTPANSMAMTKSTPADLMMLTPAKIVSGPARAETPKSRETKSIKRVRRRTQNQINSTPAKPVQRCNRKAHSVSPPIVGCYASSKWSDSPLARSIPLPPTSWLEQTSGGSSISSASTSDSESSSSAIHSTSPFPEPRQKRNPEVFQFTPKTCRQDEQATNVDNISGRRMCPLKLISEVMALSVAN